MAPFYWVENEKDLSNTVDCVARKIYFIEIDHA